MPPPDIPATGKLLPALSIVVSGIANTPPATENRAHRRRMIARVWDYVSEYIE